MNERGGPLNKTSIVIVNRKKGEVRVCLGGAYTMPEREGGIQ